MDKSRSPADDAPFGGGTGGTEAPRLCALGEVVDAAVAGVRDDRERDFVAVGVLKDLVASAEADVVRRDAAEVRRQAGHDLLAREAQHVADVRADAEITELARVDGVAPVVAGAIRDESDEIPVGPASPPGLNLVQHVADRFDDGEVAELVAGATDEGFAPERGVGGEADGVEPKKELIAVFDQMGGEKDEDCDAGTDQHIGRVLHPEYRCPED